MIWSQNNNFIMSGKRDQFQLNSPTKILDKASTYARNLKAYHDLPKATSKSMVVAQLASTEKEDIDYAIQKSKYQLDLYRKKQQQDIQARNNYHQKRQHALEKVERNEKEIHKKHQKKAESYNKHLDTTYKRYQEEERRHRQNQKQQAYKLRKQLQEFYDKEAERKREAEHRQVNVETQYQKAVERINRIHQKNEKYAMKAEMELDQQLRRNSHSPDIIRSKRRVISALNNQKNSVYNKSLHMFDDKQTRYIQQYGKNEVDSIKAHKQKQTEKAKEQKRIGQFLKKRTERWSMQKRRIDDAKAQVPQKCQHILDKTSRSFFSRTVSTFRDSYSQWEDIVKKNKSLIKERDQLQKDEIMNLHLDLRLKNNSSFKISQKMGSMKHQARRMADSYL